MSLLLSFLASLPGSLSQGLLWSLMALGVYITFKILDFADMTCDGSFALGGCISATMVVALGMNPYISLLVALLAGMLAGAVTGLLHTKLKIPAILSGILTMIALYSINLRIMGQANTPLLGVDTIVSLIKSIVPASISGSIKDSTLQTYVVILIGFVFTLAVIGLLYWFFGTEAGSALRATGNNEDMIRALGQNTDTMKILGLMTGNGLVGLSGALVAQSQSVADIGMGQGAIVIGLASIVIGEVIGGALFGKKLSFAIKLTSVVIGSIIYRIIIAAVLTLGLNTNDLKLLTAVIVAIALAIPALTQKTSKK